MSTYARPDFALCSIPLWVHIILFDKEKSIFITKLFTQQTVLCFISLSVSQMKGQNCCSAQPFM